MDGMPGALRMQPVPAGAHREVYWYKCRDYGGR
jgi:hypothetical protein